MTPGVIDPYDMAIRVDLGEIREDDLPKVFSGNAKALAECKRHLYKLRSDRLLYRNAALVDLVQKLKFASDPKTVKAAIAQCVESAQNNIKQSLSDEWKKLDLQFKGITSGFLGSEKQIDIVSNFIKDFSIALKLEFPDSTGFSTRNLSRMKKFYDI